MNSQSIKKRPDSVTQLLEQRPLQLGTRGSPLAMAQAYAVRDALCSAHGLAEAQIEIQAVKASGDKVTDRALREVGGKALWTRELDMALDAGTIDFAVHSMKDVETLRPSMFKLAAVQPRADPRDMLIGATSLDAIPQNAKLGTSSPRRAAQIRNIRPDISPILFRGNVATRLQKLADGVADVTLLAKAGLDRLGISVKGIALPLDQWLPAASQGVIGIEIRRDNDAMLRLLTSVNHDETWQCLMAERQFLETLGGNCHSAVAAYACLQAGRLHLDAAIYSEDGKQYVRNQMQCDTHDIAPITALAQSMLKAAPSSITRLFDPQP